MHKAAPKKTKSRKKGERNLTNADDKFNFNEEIVIGITVPVKEKEDKTTENTDTKAKKNEEEIPEEKLTVDNCPELAAILSK